MMAVYYLYVILMGSLLQHKDRVDGSLETDIIHTRPNHNTCTPEYAVLPSSSEGGSDDNAPVLAVADMIILSPDLTRAWT